MNTSQKTTLLIMAAGLGSRYGGDKQVDRVGPDGEILLQYSIFDAVSAGFSRIVLVIKPQYRELLEKICRDILPDSVEVCFVYQDFDSLPRSFSLPVGRTKPFGTVHAVLCAKEVIDGPFAVINADDFYGRDAFEVMQNSLTSIDKGKAVMVAYRLKNTVSPNGSVTRGICLAEDGILTSVREVYDICTDAVGRIVGRGGEPLDGEVLVSMNMWGFSADVFEDLQSEFELFLASVGNATADPLRAEYVLPAFVDKMIHTSRLCVSVLDTHARWFGVTYKEDRPKVCQELLQMKLLGIYPEGLHL